MSSDPRLLAFGEMLVERVRDSVLTYVHDCLTGEIKSFQGRALHQELSEQSMESTELLKVMAPRLVDWTLEVFLQLLDTELWRPEGQRLRLEWLEGEHAFDLSQLTDALEAEYGADGDGWITRFSKYS